MFIKSVIVAVAVAVTLVEGDCPDFTFNCPTGEHFRVGTCWRWSAFNCQTCRSIESEVRLTFACFMGAGIVCCCCCFVFFVLFCFLFFCFFFVLFFFAFFVFFLFFFFWGGGVGDCMLLFIFITINM